MIQKIRKALDAIRESDRARRTIRALAAVVLLVSLGAVAYDEYQYFKADREFVDLRDQVPTSPAVDVFLSPTPGILVTPAIEEAPFDTFLSQDQKITSDGVQPAYVALYRANPDLAGWIRMPGWSVYPIDYPVMHSGDNAYYLRRNFERRHSISGCIFFDGSNDPSVLDRNFVLYGHAMRVKTMFGHLEDYPENEKEHTNHHTIYLDLLWTRLEYEVFSTYLIESTGEYRRTWFSGDEDFGGYVDMLAARSVHDFGVEVGPRDRILTLSTCDNNAHGMRVAIHAKLVRQIVFDRMDVSSADYVLPGDVTGAVVPTDVPRPSPTLSPGPTPEVSPEPSPETTPEMTPEATPEVSPEPTAEASPTLDATPAATPDATPGTTEGPSPDVSPTIQAFS